MEFLKNRQRAILENFNQAQLNIDPKLPAVMDDSQLSGVLRKQKKELDKRKKDLGKRVTNIISKPLTKGLCILPW